MKKIYNLILLTALLVSISLAGCQQQAKEPQSSALNIIFDTDMGNDIDDALALDMLYKYMDADRMNVLAIMNNKDSQYATEFIDIMNTWYGYPDIPIGKLMNGVTIDDYVNYAQNVCNLEENGKPMFRRSLDGYNTLLDSHILYRKVLAAQPDNSVIIISVGFSTNLARLLDTPADDYSPLSGKELVAKKVKLLSVMGGSFGENKRKEFNIINDVASARKLFADWPNEIVLSPFEVGAKIQFPARVIENDFKWGVNHPMVEGYKHYRPMPYDRATWDLTSVLYVAEPDSSFMEKSRKGKIEVIEDGFTNFNLQEGGKHFYLSVDSVQVKRIKNYFIDLITTKPKNLKTK